MTEAIKWAGTVVLIISTALNGQNIYPLGPMVGVIGGLLWLIGAMRMRDLPLMATNLVMLTVALVSLTLKFPHQVIYDQAGELLPLNSHLNLTGKSDEDLTDKIVEAMQLWCNETYGEDGWEYQFIEDAILDIFKFSSEQHRTLFLLKWSI